MTKPQWKKDPREWLGDMLIAKLEPMAELLLFRLEMVAVQAAGWLCAGTLPFTDAELAAIGRAPHEDFERLMQSLVAIGKVARDDARGAWYFPEIVKASELSAKRAEVARKGGGNPALKRRRTAVQEGGQRDLFKQNAGNVISAEKTKAYDKKSGGASGFNNIYINNNTKGDVVDLADRYYFALGCIRLNKKTYQAWEAKFPFVDLDKFLSERAEWLENRPQSERENWFYSTPFALKKANDRFKPDWAREEGGAA